MSAYDHGRDRQRDRPPLQPADQRNAQHGSRHAPPLDRGRDADKIKRIAQLERKKELQHATWGHAFAEHVDASDTDLETRAATGVNARGHYEGFIPENATRWKSDAACVVARDRLWSLPEAQHQRLNIEEKLQKGQPTKQSFAVRAPLSQVLGPQWHNDVYGRTRASGGKADTQWDSDRANAVAVFRRQSNGDWYLHTCYPDPNPLSGPYPHSLYGP